MAEIPSLLTAMDRLWFHHIILLTEPISIFCSKTIVSSSVSSPSSSSSSDNLQFRQDKPSTNSPPNSVSQDDYNNGVEGDTHKAENPTSRKPPKSSKKSKVGTLHRPCKSLNYVDNMEKALKLHRTLSCRTYYDLEQIEVQGFMDLGFQFAKDQITPRTMSVIPGLQRLGEGHQSNFNYETSPFEGKEEENKGGVVIRPYLSEAWKVKKPNSPLLRLRMARVSNTEDMKNCLKLWARTVASSIQLDP